MGSCRDGRRGSLLVARRIQALGASEVTIVTHSSALMKDALRGSIQARQGELRSTRVHHFVTCVTSFEVERPVGGVHRGPVHLHQRHPSRPFVVPCEQRGRARA
jgi:hypothetical protein